jgi:hypothetical protein
MGERVSGSFPMLYLSRYLGSFWHVGEKICGAFGGALAQLCGGFWRVLVTFAQL